ncbi:MAG: hypothetical protein U5L02_13180 [Rheinheimera sp.]|nr:hypothetical protein [Rheinheimera sp.]
MNKKQSYHQLIKLDCVEHKTYDGKGRPKKDAPVKSIVWQVSAEITEKQEVINDAIEQKSSSSLPATPLKTT